MSTFHQYVLSFAPLILTAHPARQSAEPGADIGEAAQSEILDGVAERKTRVAAT